ncbi:hemophore [Mycobacterium shigaense]|uniref:Heme-binding protein n=1 Tax=Mycobacterium shigaense TaxID=722731 RepID=A0A1Z4EC70_9MYCO|nr:hemophore [Mycobacterium shigaense]MEA1124092.1 hemophore [Mycobacterium shigaense]PRI17206.1 hemophore [Mycobacterium shigaense]BAX90555.1 Heme-binding protein [Mycobacterium shigaense]
MKATGARRRRRFVGGLMAAAVPGVALAVLAGPPATGASDPCAASQVARTIGSVSKSMGDYLDSHPETNEAMTAMLQQQAGPESAASLKSYFQGHPTVAADLASIAQPLTNMSMQCKLPISIPQALGLAQQAQGGGGLPALPPAATAAIPPGGALGGPSRQNNVG